MTTSTLTRCLCNKTPTLIRNAYLCGKLGMLQFYWQEWMPAPSKPGMGILMSKREHFHGGQASKPSIP